MTQQEVHELDDKLWAEAELEAAEQLPRNDPGFKHLHVAVYQRMAAEVFA